MQATVLMLIALGGLGCQNAAGDLPPFLPVAAETAAPPPSVETPPPTYNRVPAGYPHGTACPSLMDDVADDESFGRCLRNTICSFFIGRDPDVPTARQIEAASHASSYGR
jgi:hypothetical protein